jgi:tetraacyldisaccharide 4'-kinase
MDDGFSNRKIKKNKTIIVIDSKMRFGNEHLLPMGPLREPVEQIKRADEIILTDKGDEKIDEAILWAKDFKKPLKICTMKPKRIYNIKTKADVIFNKPLNTNIDENYKPKAIAFCAIGQPNQFFDFAKEYYDIVETMSFQDHHKYTLSDIKRLTLLADVNNVNIFITTQKDETKLTSLVSAQTGYSFNVLELVEELKEIE